MSPNVVILGFDSLRHDALRLRVGGVPVMPTVASLLPSAISFDNCFVASPASIPSRVAFGSGRYPIHGGHRVAANKLRADEPDLLSRFRAAGYETALVGINHMGDDTALRRMFDQRRTVPATPLPVDSCEFYAGPLDVPPEKFDQALTTDAALDWLRSRDRPAAPYLLMLNWFLPHPPYRVPRPFHGAIPRDELDVLPARPAGAWRPVWEKAATAAQSAADRDSGWWRELQGTYLDSCRYIDAEVGRVLDHLDDDTVVLLWSDHGDFAGDHGLAEKWPTCFADVVTRVPAVLWIPWRGGATVGGLTETVDLLPTLLDVCGLPVPDGLNGFSLLPSLDRPDAPIRPVVTAHGGWESALIDRLRAVADQRSGWKYRAVAAAPHALNRAVMLRDERYKYVFRLDDAEELYDLAHDPFEQRNLAADASLSPLRYRLVDAMLRGGDHQPVPELEGLIL